MNDVGIIFVAEFLRKLRSRPFIIGTLIGALTLAALVALPQIVNGAADTATRPVVLAGDAAVITPAATLLARNYDIVARVPTPAAPPTLADLNAHAKAAAYIVLRRSRDRLVVTVYARDPGTFGESLRRDLVPLNLALATHEPLAHVQPYFSVETTLKSLDAKFASAAAADAARGVAFVLVLLLYMAILLNSQIVLSSVAEEKTSRIAEILVATTSPARLLTGKILAAGALGIIQLTVWIAMSLASGTVLAAAGDLGSSSDRALAPALGAGPGGITGPILAGFIVFFLIGFMQYATLYAAAASLINRTEDLGSVAAPLVAPVIGGFFLAQYALAFPQSAGVAVLSFVPLLSPFVMFTRMIVSTVPGWQLALAIAINLGAAVAIIWAAGKVYRVGLLLYGRPPSFKQVAAALRA